ncbi:MAG: altronate dehydratase [Oceanicaulis sp.]|uniref:UxaA family hydrolase n=1 Tax=Glycocaulis sp. TaxID=1969725 RepID=UPI0025BB1F78|nr:altronate dehydratase family protein [Glycocaulis sp.]MCC5980366.1 altronate dehydratase [Oceanicaulis sp.]MCH8522890.1 altronate dehydratase family protein [Glycocaulis sp.]
MDAGPPGRLREALKLHRDDSVAVALTPLSAGRNVNIDGVDITLREDIPKGHKFALHPVSEGARIIKYGWPIGAAITDIESGTHVHVHNVATLLTPDTRLDYAADNAAIAPGSRPLDGQFQGYRRANGQIGIRNEIWVIATVGCVTRTAQRIADAASKTLEGRIDGVHAITHPFGCSQLGDDLAHTRAILAALAGHPNAGGVLIVGLGCESNQIDKLLEAAPDLDRTRIRAFAAQAAGDEMEEGLGLIEELAAIAEKDVRSPCPLSDLVIGVKCGGSDGFSGLTANPLVGRMSECVAGAGGTALLTEIPEIFGAEHLLLSRTHDEQTFNAGAALVERFKRYFERHGEPVHENPSPGNIAGGITTLEEKSLGAVQKAGAAQLTSVLDYGQQVSAPGLALLEAPGNDAVSSTALAAAGAQIILFTTGRGTPLGFPVPTLKIASNSDLAARKSHWIDFDAGTVLAGDSMEEAADRLFALILDTANGQPARNEINGEREIAIWKSGVTL